VRRRTLLALGLPLTLGSLAVLPACGGRSSAAWSDVPPAPGAETYEGSIEKIVDERLSDIVAERHLRLVDSRLEVLPAGVAWADHRAFRDDHAAGLHRVEERVPEPDAPVLTAEYAGRDRALFVIARATEDRTRLVVLTALTTPA
jgi:hypothetical protein